MPTLHVTITGQGRKAMADLVRTHHVRVLHATVRRSGSRRYAVDAMIDASSIPELTAAGYEVQENHDVSEVGRERQREVGKGNRYTRKRK